ncbi:MAG: glycosyltransferase, partial [Actinomycetota bacterium]
GLTDTDFFRPPTARVDNSTPLVAGCGVEQRDYATMGTALGGAEVDVEVCFASPNQSDKTRYTMPDPVPPNMAFRHMEFTELRDLYQRADVMVLSVRENRYSAGLTSLFEAIACEAPVVVSESAGIIDQLIADGLVVGVPVADADAVRAAVDGILADPKQAVGRAVAARKVLQERYSSDAFLDRLDAMLQRFAAAASHSPSPSG